MNGLSRVADAAQMARVSSAMQDAQARMRERQIEVSSGKRASAYAELGGDAGLLVGAKAQRAQTMTFSAEGKKVGDRLQVMDSTLGGLGDLAERFKSLLVQRLNGATGSGVPLAAEADSGLAEAASQLNRQLDGRYLFAGSRIDTAPVALPAAPAVATDATLYYHGDDVAATARVDADTVLSYGITAAATPFADLIGAMGQARAANAGNDTAGLQAAMDRLDKAIDGLAQMRGQIGVTSDRLQRIGDQHAASAGYLDDVVSRIEDTDVPTAMTQLAQDQAMLQASYTITGRLAGLSLAEYLH